MNEALSPEEIFTDAELAIFESLAFDWVYREDIVGILQHVYAGGRPVSARLRRMMQENLIIQLSDNLILNSSWTAEEIQQAYVSHSWEEQEARRRARRGSRKSATESWWWKRVDEPRNCERRSPRGKLPDQASTWGKSGLVGGRGGNPRPS